LPVADGDAPLRALLSLLCDVGVPSMWGMEERSGGVNGRNGPGLGTRGFPLAVGCIDCAGAWNRNTDLPPDLSPRRARRARDVRARAIPNCGSEKEPSRIAILRKIEREVRTTRGTTR
jgi:hypothetical protein